MRASLVSAASAGASHTLPLSAAQTSTQLLPLRASVATDHDTSFHEGGSGASGFVGWRVGASVGVVGLRVATGGAPPPPEAEEMQSPGRTILSGVCRIFDLM